MWNVLGGGNDASFEAMRSAAEKTAGKIVERKKLVAKLCDVDTGKAPSLLGVNLKHKQDELQCGKAVDDFSPLTPTDGVYKIALEGPVRWMLQSDADFV